MNPVQLIIKKRDKQRLTKPEIHFFITEYLNGNISEYQMSAMLMAILLKGMDLEETYWLTQEYIESGEVIKFENTNSRFIDKHSTGGVGDKVSLILAPIAAECGISVPMISGKGLGHTGGTLDKLESIPGFQIQTSLSRFKELVLKNGLAVISQSKEIVPADRRIYALRDVTGTVESIPLMTASIMSKKIASGIDGLVIDLKVGNGAFIRDIDTAKKLAESFNKIGARFGKKVEILFTNMDSPLGTCVGNSIEVIESVDFLKGNYQKDLKEVTFVLLSEMLIMAGIVRNYDKAENMILQKIKSGRALQRFAKFVELQGGNPDIVNDYSILGEAEYSLPIIADSEGYIKDINSREIGWALIDIGAGRKKVSDKIDHQAGVKLYKKVGDKISKGDALGEVFYNKGNGKIVANNIKKSYQIGAKPVQKRSMILGTFSSFGV
ncbi:MAG: thymidine phosphorylase [Candidatus Cloacimonetes bacterium]|nr:thymidine phosphorylase [Candidatus Cloacimonadota bacterium]